MWTQMYVTLQTKRVFLSKEIIDIFYQPLCFIFSIIHFNIEGILKGLYTVYPFLQKIGHQDYHLFEAMHITIRGLRFVDVGIIYPYWTKICFKSHSQTTKIFQYMILPLLQVIILGLPRLKSSRKSSDIPLPIQSPTWVNPMGPITLSFGKKCYNVTTCKLASQKVLSLNACSYWTGSGHCIRDISLIWLISTRYSCQRNSFSAWLICDNLQ